MKKFRIPMFAVRNSVSDFVVHTFLGTKEYTVVHAESVVKIRKDAPLEKVCLLGGGVAAALGMVA